MIEGMDMTLNGVSGVFLTDAEFDKLIEAGSDRVDQLTDLEMEVFNLKNAVQDARSSVYDALRTLDNA